MRREDARSASWLLRMSNPTIETNTATQTTMRKSSCGSHGTITVWRTAVSSAWLLQSLDWGRCHPNNLQWSHHSLPGCSIRKPRIRSLRPNNGSNLVSMKTRTVLMTHAGDLFSMSSHSLVETPFCLKTRKKTNCHLPIGRLRTRWCFAPSYGVQVVIIIILY